MPITGYHVFTSPVADGTNTQLVRPSNWNSAHVFTANLSGSEISNAFSNANGITFGTTAGGQITASHNALTTAALSDHSHGNPTLALTNLSGTTASNSNGFTLSLSANVGGGAGDGYNILAAGTQTAGTANTVLFNNANGITFGMSNSSVITASHNGLTQQSTQPVAVSAANGSFAFSTMTLANSNGVSFSTGTQGVYATVATNYQSQGAYLTTARASNDAIGLNTALTANGLSVTANSSGLSINVPAFLTTAAQSNHSHGNPTLALTNINGTTASASNGLTLSLSAIVPAQTVQPVAASGSNGSFAFSTLSFGASNGLTFYTTNGSIVASYTDAGAGGGVNFSAGTTSNNLAAVTFANSNGVSFGLNGSTMTASVNAGGENTVSTLIPYFPYTTSTRTMGAQGASTASIHFFPLSLEHAVAFNNVRIALSNSFVTSTVSGQQSLSWNFGLYSQNGTNLSLISSNSLSFGITNSSVSATINYATATSTSGYGYNTTGLTTTAQIQSLFGTAGDRMVGLQFGGNITLTEGLYWIGLHQRQSSSSANIGFNSALRVIPMFATGMGFFGSSTAPFATNVSYNWAWGVFTSTGSLGHSGTNIFSPVPISGISQVSGVMPMLTFIST